MSRKKIEKPKISPFQVKLNEFQSVTIEILRTQPSEANAKALKALTEKHALLSSELSALNPVNQDKKNLDRIRISFTADQRKQLNKTLSGLIVAKEKSEQKIKNEYARRESVDAAVLEQIKVLAPKVQEAANLYMDTATIQTMDALYADFKSQKTELHRIINSFADDTKKSSYTGVLSKLSEAVNKHTVTLNRKAAEVKREINEIVAEAEKIVHSMDVVELVQAIMPAATKKEIFAIMNGKDAQVLQLKDHADANGELVLANLPSNKQLALVAVILNELSALDADTPEGALTKQFIQAMVNNIQALQSGRKKYLSMVAKVGDVIQVIHLDILTLLTDYRSIANVLNNFVLNGVTTESIVMTLTSKQEALALRQLGNLDVLQLEQQGTLTEITGKVMAVANNPGALSLITGKEVTEHSLAVFGTDNAGKGFRPDQILELLKKIVTFQIAKDMIADAFTKKQGVLGQLDKSVKLGAIEGAVVHQFIDQIPTDLHFGLCDYKQLEPANDKTPDSHQQKTKRKAPDLNGQKAMIMALLNDLEDLKTALELRAQSDAKYLPVSIEAAKLHTYLTGEATAFFNRPTPKALERFKKNCSTAIENAENEFSKHRGLWWDDSGILGALLVATKAILGLIAGVTVVPAVFFSAATKHGYLDTFFFTPKTDSAAKLNVFKDKLSLHEDEMDQAFKSASPAA